MQLGSSRRSAQSLTSSFQLQCSIMALPSWHAAPPPPPGPPPKHGVVTAAMKPPPPWPHSVTPPAKTDAATQTEVTQTEATQTGADEVGLLRQELRDTKDRLASLEGIVQDLQLRFIAYSHPFVEPQ